jgi:hypothetical protein
MGSHSMNARVVEIEMKKATRGDLRIITQHSITFSARPARLVSL